MQTTTPGRSGSGNDEAGTRLRPRRILPVIVAAQFAGTSLWFAGNAVLSDLQRAYDLPATALGPLTSAVQIGFIVGTLAYALGTVADRFSPSRVFLLSALAGAVVNLAVGTVATDYAGILAFRFLTGVFLAGIYPVGMKLAADWFEAGLGRALGWLVGALVLGTAFPHLLAAVAADLPWRTVLQGTSALAAAGGVAIGWLVPDGPYRSVGKGFRPGAIAAVFRVPAFRSAALGYVGHMWELYAFWAFVPVLLVTRFPGADAAVVSAGAFAVIAVGAAGCVIGGFASARVGSARVAVAMLLVSGAIGLASPWLFGLAGAWFVAAVTLWGFAVVGDSPQFSTLVARTAPPDVRGSALTIVNSIGFAVTIPAIQALTAATVAWPPERIWLPLALGPIAGIVATAPLVRGVGSTRRS